MKSTPDLLGNFRTIVPKGEELRDFFMRQKPKEPVNLEEVIKESMIEASNTEDKAQLDLDTEINAIDDAADVLLAAQNDFDEDEVEADLIRLDRLRADKTRVLNQKSDLERIFCDSGLGFHERRGGETNL